MLKLQGFNVASVTEMARHAVGDYGPLDYSAPIKCKMSLSVGRAPLAGNQDHVINRSSRRRPLGTCAWLPSSLAAMYDFMTQTFNAGAWVGWSMRTKSQSSRTSVIGG